MKSKIRSCFEQITKHPNQEYVWAIVIESNGSVPQPKGAVMLLNPSGLLIGSVGGGLLEYQCLQKAHSLFGTDQAEVLEFQMNEAYAKDAGPICGGKLKVLISNKIKSQLSQFQNIYELFQKDELFHIWVDLSESNLGAVNSTTSEELIQENSFELKIENKRKLLISGGGHCGLAISDLGAWLDFDVHVIDPRQEISHNNPAVQVHHQRFEAFCSKAVLDSNTAIVLVNKGHKDDREALEFSIHESYGYLGMIGSRRKISLLKNEFLDQGLCNEKDWKKIHAPIGFDLNAIEVKDIALSIMSEITAIMNGKAIDKTASMSL